MKVEFVEENEDGSGVFTFDFNEDEKNALLRYGIIAILEKAIEEDKYKAKPLMTEESDES
jgi:hypothetical protein